MASFELKIQATGDWVKARAMLDRLKAARSNRTWEKVVEHEAKLAARLVRQNLNTRGKLTGTTWPRLKRLTWKMKKSKRILFESGRLAKAITARKDGSAWFIGVVSTEKPPGSNISLRDLASVHEHGTTIVQKWTPKQRAAFFALLRKFGELRRGGRRKSSPWTPSPMQRDSRGRFSGRSAPVVKGMGVVIIRIPARPFVFPVLDRLFIGGRAEVEARILKRLKSALKLE